jgi:antitoxin CptB
MTTDDARLKKLKLRSWRRGFREADLILGPFADKYVSTFSPEELDTFEDLIEQPDQMLFGWIMGTETVPNEFDGPMLNRIKVFRDEVYADGYDAG